MIDFVLVITNNVRDRNGFVLTILQVSDGYGITLLVQDPGAIGFAIRIRDISSGGTFDALVQDPDISSAPVSADDDRQPEWLRAIGSRPDLG